jgi:hypothetical protein
MAQGLPDSQREMDALRSAIVVTGIAAQQYAEIALIPSPYELEMHDFKTASSPSVPSHIARLLSNLRRPPLTIEGTDVRVTYDKLEGSFATQEVSFQLDTGQRLNFKRSADIGRVLGKEGDVFLPILIDQHGREAAKDPANLARPEDVHEMLRSIGLEIPAETEQADWEAVDPSLAFTEFWRRTSIHAKQLTARRRVRVEERFDGSGIAPALEPYDVDDPLTFAASEQDANDVVLRELVIGIEESRKDGQPPTSSLQLVQKSEHLNDPLRYHTLYRTPIRYIYSNDTNALPMRQERGKQKIVTPTVANLGAIRGNLQLAQGLIERRPSTAE